MAIASTAIVSCLLPVKDTYPTEDDVLAWSLVTLVCVTSHERVYLWYEGS